MKITDEQILETFGIDARDSDMNIDLILQNARDLIAMAQKVPDLEWDNFEESSKSKCGMYTVIQIGDRGWLPCVQRSSDLVYGLIDGAQSFQPRNEAKAYCNEHNRKRVLGQLKYGGE